MCRHLVFVAALVSTHSTLTHDRVTDNQGRTGCFGFRLGQCPADFRYIVSVDCDDFQMCIRDSDYPDYAIPGYTSPASTALASG